MVVDDGHAVITEDINDHYPGEVAGHHQAWRDELKWPRCCWQQYKDSLVGWTENSRDSVMSDILDMQQQVYLVTVGNRVAFELENLHVQATI